MTDQEWLARAGSELRRRAVPERMITQVLGEVAAHAGDSGAPATRSFGIPEAYAAQVAASLAGPPPGRAPGWTGDGTAPARGGRAPGPVRLAARGIGKRRGRRWVLRDVDLDLRAGQAVAVVGANGAGKSTFLGICAGFISPDTGEVGVAGSVGFCPQFGGTLDHLRPDEHFTLLGAGHGMSRARSRQTGRALAAALQWNTDLAESRVQARRLSGGTRQKLNLALAAVGDPDILLLDEPYQGFDQATYLAFWEQVWRWRDRGKAVMVVTHLLENLERVDAVVDLTAAGSQGRTGR